MPDDNTHELIMPFVVTTSNGGPYDDSAYAAGWEMGMLDSCLRYTQPPVLDIAIHRANAPQADLVAMNHGYQAHLTEHDDDWAYLHLTKPTPDGTP